MSRVKLSEYKAKQLIMGESYTGIQIRSGQTATIPDGHWVAKVDQGVKNALNKDLLR